LLLAPSALDTLVNNHDALPFHCIDLQVCVAATTYANNVALPAFARRAAAVRRAAIDRYLLPSGPQQQTSLLWPMLGQTDGQTDGRRTDA